MPQKFSVKVRTNLEFVLIFIEISKEELVGSEKQKVSIAKRDGCGRSGTRPSQYTTVSKESDQSFLVSSAVYCVDRAC